MTHDYSLVFDIESPYWQKVLDIFEKNEKYEKKVVSNRNLHHKFPRSFSKKLGEPVDNDKDNLISLTLAEHFLVHYYYYLLAKKGYRQAMATAFTFMARKCLKYITPETAELMADDYENAQCIAYQASSNRMCGENNPSVKNGVWNKGKRLSKEHRENISKNHYDISGENNPNYGKKLTDETKQKLSNTRKEKGLSKGENNPMYGKTRSDFSSKYKEHYGYSKKENRNQYEKERRFYLSNGHFSWDINNNINEVTK